MIFEGPSAPLNQAHFKNTSIGGGLMEAFRLGGEAIGEEDCHQLPVHSTPSPVNPSGQGPQTKPDSLAGGFKSIHCTPG